MRLHDVGVQCGLFRPIRLSNATASNINVELGEAKRLRSAVLVRKVSNQWDPSLTVADKVQNAPCEIRQTQSRACSLTRAGPSTGTTTSGASGMETPVLLLDGLVVPRHLSFPGRSRHLCAHEAEELVDVDRLGNVP
jgi:hypothetical protein